MGLKKRIKKLEKERMEIMLEITDIDVKEMSFFVHGAHGLEEIMKAGEEKDILIEKRKSIENEILANNLKYNLLGIVSITISILLLFYITLS